MDKLKPMYSIAQIFYNYVCENTACLLMLSFTHRSVLVGKHGQLALTLQGVTLFIEYLVSSCVSNTSQIPIMVVLFVFI